MPSKKQPQKPLFSFGVIADVQYCDCDTTGTRVYRASPDKLREALNTFKSGQISFVINLGDLIDHNFQSYEPVMKIIDSSGLKIYHVAGNHDYAVEWNGGLSGEQLTWLKEELDEAVSKSEKVFLICHFPIVPDNVHNLLNYKEVRALLSNYHNIIAWFSGHNHAGNYGNFNMIHFVTFRGMVETESKNSYAVVDVYTNKLWIRGFGREKSQILAY